jgi:pilus assembly protein CpaC
MIRRHRTIRTISPALLAALSTAAWYGACAQTKAVAAATTAPLAGEMSSNAQLVGEPLHLLVGRSMFVNTDNRIRRVYVSNPDILDSFTSSPHQIVITSKAPGLSTLVLWDEAGQSRAYLINSDVDVSNLHHALQDAFPNENIRVEGRGDQVALAGTVASTETADAAVKLAGLFSKDVADSLQVATKHTPQVRLKVRVIEIDRSRAEQLGFNFFGPGVNTFSASTGQFGAVTVGSGAPTSGSAPTAGNSLLSLTNLLGLFYYNQGMQLGAAVQALLNKQIAQILAEPTITAISGEKASFLSGGEFPYPVVQGGTGGFTSVTIQFRPYGVKLDFTPNVLADGTIQLKVAPEVSALDYSNEVVISGYTIPAISTRRAETQVQLKRSAVQDPRHR